MHSTMGAKVNITPILQSSIQLCSESYTNSCRHALKTASTDSASKKKNSVGSESGKVLLMHLDLDAMEED